MILCLGNFVQKFDNFYNNIIILSSFCQFAYQFFFIKIDSKFEMSLQYVLGVEIIL